MAATEVTGRREQQVGAAVDTYRLPGNGDILAGEVEALGHGQAQTLDTGGPLDLAGDQCSREVIGVRDAIVAGERVLAEELRKAQVGGHTVEDGDVALVAIGRAHVEEPGLQCLDRILAQPAAVALQHQAGIDGEGGQHAGHRTAAFGIAIERIVRGVQTHLGREEPASTLHGVADLRVQHQPRAFHRVGARVGELGQVHQRGDIETVQVDLVVGELQLGHLLVGGRRARFQNVLVADATHHHVPVVHAAGEIQLARQRTLGGVDQGVGVIDKIVVVRDPLQVPGTVPAQHVGEEAVGIVGMTGMVGVAVVRNVVKLDVALGRPRQEAEFVAQPQAAPGGELRRDGKVVVGRQIEVIRRSDAQTRARVDGHGGKQEAALAGIVEREHHHRHAQHGVITHLEARIAPVALRAFQVQIQALGLQSPRLVVGLAAGEAAVDKLHEAVADEIDAISLPTHAHGRQVVGRGLERSPPRVELQLQARPHHAGSRLLDGDIAGRIDALLLAPVLDAAGLERRADLAQLGIALEDSDRPLRRGLGGHAVGTAEDRQLAVFLRGERQVERWRQLQGHGLIGRYGAMGAGRPLATASRVRNGWPCARQCRRQGKGQCGQTKSAVWKRHGRGGSDKRLPE